MNTKKPLISIIIPAYNHEKYIQETIKSAINQTYENLELIIIDDGSPDSTLKKIEEMQEVCKQRFVNFSYKTQENAGTCETLNRLIQSANGKYIFLTASDDMLKPKCIEKEADFLENHKDYVLCVGDNDIIDDDGRICYWDEKLNNVYDINQARYVSYGNFLQTNRSLNFCKKAFGKYCTLINGNYIPNGYLIRKSVFEKTGLYRKDAPLEDWYMNLQLSKYGKFKYLNEIVYSYRWHSSNTIKQTQKMWKYTKLTRDFEIKNLKKTNFLKVRKEVFPFIILAKLNQMEFYYKLFLPVLKYIFKYLSIIQKKESRRQYFLSKQLNITCCIKMDKCISACKE